MQSTVASNCGGGSGQTQWMDKSMEKELHKDNMMIARSHIKFDFIDKNMYFK